MPEREEINLFSDTVTKPTPAMYEAMVSAELGDDMFGEDPTTNRLEAEIADRLGKEAAVFTCTATQANQIAVRVHCRPGDELLIHRTGHIANHEAGGPAALSGVTCRLLDGPHGMLDVDHLEGTPRPDDQHFPPTRLVCIENTTNVGGGRAYPLARLRRVAEWSRRHGLKVHMDGARFFNAVVATDQEPDEIAAAADTVTVCFSKGLGCPMGAVLVGSAADIARARRFRKLFGGALRQTGVVAGAALYAIGHHVERLRDDHGLARLFAQEIAEIEGIQIDPDEVETNLVFFGVDPQLGTAAQLSAEMHRRGVRVGALGPQRIRAVTHLDVDRSDILRAAAVLRECVAAGLPEDAAAAVQY
jgi:threonine aldolase